MLTTLTLKNFKNFQTANLSLGSLTTLIGANASGKSNIRDAFRFLHGIGRGYSLAEIMGEKYGDGGELLWRGIRGGPREIAYQGAKTFALNTTFTEIEPEAGPVFYDIEIEPNDGNNSGAIPKVILENLYSSQDIRRLSRDKNLSFLPPNLVFLSELTRNPHNLFLILDSDKISSLKSEYPKMYDKYMPYVAKQLQSMRFFDLQPNAMRRPSFPGQTVLGDQGENLSSVLQAICQNNNQKEILLSWLQELTPMDATDFEFISDQTGRVLVNLIEANGQRTSAYSASDGTLRFLAMLAALLGPEPARLYFFEEIEVGLHPSRLYLLLNLIETQAKQRDIQVIITTHSPQALRFLSQTAREYASLIYRLPGTNAAQIKRMMDIPHLQQALHNQDLAELHESNWFEDVLFFEDDESA